jgi:hypothetical protein
MFCPACREMGAESLREGSILLLHVGRWDLLLRAGIFKRLKEVTEKG